MGLIRRSDLAASWKGWKHRVDGMSVMRVLNEHLRLLPASPESVGELMNTLASRGDLLWPHERWPRMKFDGPLAVGAAGGHGPIRYTIQDYDPGRRIVFRFTAPVGFHGTHSFAVSPREGGCELRHVLEMRVSGRALLIWPLVIRHLHDALLEDALDKAESVLNEGDWVKRRWPFWVRVLRRLLAGR